MLARGGTVLVSRLRYQCRRGWINVAPSEGIAIEYPYPTRLFYSLSISPLATKEIHPPPNRNRHMPRSRPRHLSILPLSQARHALVVDLSVMVALFLQRQRDDVDFVAGQFPILVLSAKNICSACDDGEGVMSAGEKGGAGDAFEGGAEGLGGLREAVGGDGAAFDGGGDDLFGGYEAGHCCWVHGGWNGGDGGMVLVERQRHGSIWD